MSFAILAAAGSTNIFGFFLLGVVVLFIFLFNTMAMQRKNLERLRHLIHCLLLRRVELAEKLLPEYQSPAPGTSFTERLKADMEINSRLASMPEPDPEAYQEFSQLGPQLTAALEQYRQSATRYNEWIARPNTQWLVRLFKLKAQELF